MATGKTLAIFLLVSQVYISTHSLTTMSKNSSAEMLETIMLLHLDYCDYLPSCSSGVTRAEPETEKPPFPIPCCPPCSCLQTCIKQANCCPEFESGPLHNPSLELQSPRYGEGNQTLGSSEQKMNVEIQLHANSSMARTAGQENRTRDNSTDRGNMNTHTHRRQTTVDAKLTCVRPQVLVDVNVVPDSQAYKMVTSCLYEYGHTYIPTPGKMHRPSLAEPNCTQIYDAINSDVELHTYFL